MIDFSIQGIYPPSLQALVDSKVASRIHSKDATLYSFSEEAQQCAQEYMGWATLASEPPCSIEEIQSFADEMRAKGLKAVVLIGQGGSTQAPMTLTKYNKPDSSSVELLNRSIRFLLFESEPLCLSVILSIRLSFSRQNQAEPLNLPWL